MQQDKRLIIATVLSMMILLSWSWFYERPRLEKAKAANLAKEHLKQQNLGQKNSKNAASNPVKGVVAAKNINSDGASKSLNEEIGSKKRTQIIEETKQERVAISSDMLHGSILLRGARFDDLTLANYFKENPRKKDRKSVV